MQVHLVDGTYELFRHYFALPEHLNRDGQEVSATRGVLGSLLGMLEDGATHVGVATDHVVESFRNELYEGYKTGEGLEEEIHSQFPLLEETLEAAGFAVWPMQDHEADDGMATGAALAGRDSRVERVWLCTPDKDLAQCVEGTRIVMHDRRKGVTMDEAGVHEKFGVGPASIPDYLGLMGDSADGFPGLPGWGARSSATVLAHYEHIEAIPESVEDWAVKVRGAARLAATLVAEREDALLYRHLATLVRDAPEVGPVDSWRWTGPAENFEEICDYLDSPRLPKRAQRLAEGR
jgi:5'-3' exonuclease